MSKVTSTSLVVSESFSSKVLSWWCDGWGWGDGGWGLLAFSNSSFSHFPLWLWMWTWPGVLYVSLPLWRGLRGTSPEAVRS